MFASWVDEDDIEIERKEDDEEFADIIVEEKDEMKKGDVN